MDFEIMIDYDDAIDVINDEGEVDELLEANSYFPEALNLYKDIVEVRLVNGFDDEDEYDLEADETIVYSPYNMISTGGYLCKPRPCFLCIGLRNKEEHYFPFGKEDTPYDYADVAYFRKKSEEIKLLVKAAKAIKQIDLLKERIWSFEYDHNNKGEIMEHLDKIYPVAQISTYFIEELEHEEDFEELEYYDEDRMTVMLEAFKWVAEKNEECYKNRLSYFLEMKEKYNK